MELNGFFLVFVVLIILLFLGVLSSLLIQTFRKPKNLFADYTMALEAILDGDQRSGIQKLKDAIRNNTENIEGTKKNSGDKTDEQNNCQFLVLKRILKKMYINFCVGVLQKDYKYTQSNNKK